MKKSEDLLRLIEEAIVIAEAYEKSGASADWLKSDCHLFIQNLQKLSQRVQSGEDCSSEGAGLGITRFLSEIEAPDDLYAAGRAIDEFFQEEMK
jgi:hypothetical protein